MSNQASKDLDHDEIISILPWFVNKTLDIDERTLVLRHIEHCDECRREIQLLETLNEVVQNDAENSHAIHADVDKNLASVMDRINAESKKSNDVTSTTKSLHEKLGEIFNFATALPFPQWSATALAGLLVAVVGVQLYQSQISDDYSVLSSSEIENSRIRLAVEMTAIEDREQVHSIIQFEADKLGQRVSIETNADAAYTIVFKDAVAVSELSNLIAALERQVQISRVEILP